MFRHHFWWSVKKRPLSLTGCGANFVPLTLIWPVSSSLVLIRAKLNLGWGCGWNLICILNSKTSLFETWFCSRWKPLIIGFCGSRARYLHLDAVSINLLKLTSLFRWEASFVKQIAENFILPWIQKSKTPVISACPAVYCSKGSRNTLPSQKKIKSVCLGNIEPFFLFFCTLLAEIDIANFK